MPEERGSTGSLPAHLAEVLREPTLRERLGAESDKFLQRFFELGALGLFAFYLFHRTVTEDARLSGNLLVFIFCAFVPARIGLALGWKTLARAWFLVSTSSAMAILPWTVNGLRSPGFQGVPVMLLMIAWLQGRRWMLFAAGVFSLVTLVYWFAETSGLWVMPVAPRGVDVWAYVYIQIIALTCLALWFLVGNFEATKVTEAALRKQLAQEGQRLERANRGLADVFDGLTAHVCVLDGQGNIVSVNRAWRDFFEANGGSSTWEHVGANYLAACSTAVLSHSPDQREAASFYVQLQQVLDDKLQHFELQYPCDSADQRRWFIARVERIRGADPVRIVVAHDDVTAIRMAQEDLQKALGFSRKLIESMQEGFSVIDVHGVAQDANPALCRMLGFTREELVGRSAPHPYWPPEEMESIQRAFEATLQGESNTFELTFMRKNGERFPVSVAASAVKNELGQIINFIATVSDITERKLAHEQIHRLAYYDPLTNLPNRRLLNDRMQWTISGCKRSGKYAALLVLDLDNFKSLNDAHGHAAGDLLLIETAKRLKSCVREIDTVARFGGDEFVVLVNELSADPQISNSQCKVIAEKVRAYLAEPYVLTSELRGRQTVIEHQCTASIGVALFNGSVADGALVLERADHAMYAAKEAGRNQVRFFEDVTAS